MTTNKDRVVEQLYDQMHKMEVMLDDDPLQFGPKRLNNKIAELRNMLTELENSSRIDFINTYMPLFSKLVQTKLLCIKTDIMFNTALTMSLLATRWKRKTSSSKLNKLS